MSLSVATMQKEICLSREELEQENTKKLVSGHISMIKRNSIINNNGH